MQVIVMLASVTFVALCFAGVGAGWFIDWRRGRRRSRDEQRSELDG